MNEKRLDWRTATDAEKNAAVAEARGLDLDSHAALSFSGYRSPCPDYLRDPRAWWPLVEEMHHAELRRYPARDGKPGFAWSVWTGSIPKEPDSVSRSPGEAACIAYLRSQGWEVVT